MTIRDGDWYSRYYVHGLNLDFLRLNGLPSVRELRLEFYRWIDNLPFGYQYYFFANNPAKEKKEFPLLPFLDICIPPWSERAC